MGLWHAIIPQAGTNLCINPSIETETANWTTAGTNTVAQSSAQAFKGAYSLLWTYGNSTLIGDHNDVTPSASTTYYFSCWVYVPANWDGGNIRCESSLYSDAVDTYNNIYTHGTSPTAQWVYLETKVAIGTDTAGSWRVVATSAPTVGRTVYVDALQIEQNANYATTYVDGDQPGCKWSGVAHGSTSTRSSQERSGGRVLDLEVTYSVKVRQQAGSGMAFSSHKSQKQALMPGALFRGTKPEPRTMTLLCTPLATSVANLHAIRDDLIDAVKPDLVSGEREVVLRYTGSNASRPVEIKAVYDTGMEFGEPAGKIENIPLRFIAYDPYWYEIGNGAAALTTSVSETHSYLSRRVDGNWEDMNAAGPIYTIAIDDNYVYVGGTFTNWGDANGDNIVRYDRAAGTWSSLGTGCNDAVRSIVIAADGSLYVGGDFTLAGGVANTDGIAKWTGSAWAATGTGISAGANIVRALAIDQAGNLYAGGDFTGMGGIANTSGIAKWNGTAWSSITSSSLVSVYALTVAPDNSLYIGGTFINIGDANGDRVLKWDGSALSSLSTGITAGQVNSLVVSTDGTLYAGGTFTVAGGVTVNYVAKWNGTTFKALESGLTGGTGCFGLNFAGNLLYVSGDFTTAGDLTVDGQAIWNGSTWAHMDLDLSGSPTIYTAVEDPYNDNLYISYSTAGASLTSAVNTVTNNSTTRSYPKVTIKRSGGTSATVAYLRNETTGATLWINYALLDGETLTLDFTPGSRSITSSMFGTVWRALLKPSDFSQFYLLPGSNDIIAFVNVVGAPTMTQYMTWPLSHWSCDGVA